MENRCDKYFSEIKKAFDSKKAWLTNNEEVTFQKGLSMEEICQIEDFL